MTHITPKMATIEFAIHPDTFREEWEFLNPDKEPTQKDYDEWLIDCTQEWIYDYKDQIRDYSFAPHIKLMEDN